MNRFWNVSAGGACAVSLAVIIFAGVALYLGKMDGQTFAAVCGPIASAWIVAMTRFLPEKDHV